MKKKIVLLGPYPPPYGGVSIYISTLFEIFRDRGVHLWTYGDRELSAANVRFMKDKRRQLLPLLLREGRGARIADCTHFLLEYPSAIVPAWVAAKRALKFEWIKIVQDGSLPSRYQLFSPARRKLFRMAQRAISEFVVLNDELRRWLVDEIGVRQNVTVIKNIFPTAACDQQSALPAEIKRAASGHLNRAKRVCSIGVFIPDYGFAHVAEAVERLRTDTREDVGLLLLDGDFAETPGHRDAVLRDRPWITVLKNVPHPLVFQLLKRSDVFVRGFGLESYGLSRVEALWCGLPVVATRAGETRGMLLYDFGDVDALTAQLKKALAGDHRAASEKWAALYRREAEENLKAIAKKLGVSLDR